jgi:hypothetical protein
MSGLIRSSPKEAWKDMERVFGIKYPVSERLTNLMKGEKDVKGKGLHGRKSGSSGRSV